MGRYKMWWLKKNEKILDICTKLYKKITRILKSTIKNKSYSSKKVVVENALSGLKRFHVLSNKLRLHDTDLYNKVLGCCAAHWNFKIS